MLSTNKIEKVFKCWVIDGSKVLVVTTNLILIYNYLNLQADPVQIPRNDVLPDEISHINEYFIGADSCANQQDPNNFSFWLTIFITAKDYPTIKAKGNIQGERATGGNMKGMNNWIVKAKLNKQTNKVVLTDESVLLKDELAMDVLEYEPGSLLISTYKSRNLVKCEGLKKFTNIVGPDENNEMMYSIQLLPGFHKVTYPFFVVTGKSQIWLGNMSKCWMQTLVYETSRPFFDSPGVVFLGKRKD